MFYPPMPSINLKKTENRTYQPDVLVAAFYPQEDSWYSFLLEAELTPGP
jgi:hypothetical protein